MMDKITRELRKRCLEISYKGQDGNLQSCFSSMEILWSLYCGAMNWNKDIAQSENRDKFILSKGQSSLALVVVLEKLGLLQNKEVEEFCKFGAKTSMQLDRTKYVSIGGVENSAGSLGHGFPMAVGMAYAKKIKKETSQIFVLAGDGEMNEGTMWEAAAFAGGHGVDNLTLIVDDNDSIGRMLDFGNLKKKLQAFDFEVLETDGNDLFALEECFKQIKQFRGKPKAVIAHTVRGYGSHTLMDNNEWFHKAPSLDELESLKREVDEF